jgi:NADH-quinone oxidoreductase subunit C
LNPIERIQAALPGVALETKAARDGTPTIFVSMPDVRRVVTALRDACGFETNTFVTAVDHHPIEPRFELAWQFLSYQHNDRVRVHARASGDAPRAPSIVDLYPGAGYSERECYDMFGIGFEGHTGLKRLLMPEDYDHFPLRKDFPHQGIEPDRLYREWDRRRRERASLSEESAS